MMKTAYDHNRLEIKLDRDFNLMSVRSIRYYLREETDTLVLDLTNCKIMDSEAVIFLHRWLQHDHSLTLINPPEILHEILEILKLDTAWEPHDIIETR